MHERPSNPQGEVQIAMVGKYVEPSDAYKSVNDQHAGMQSHVRVKITHVDSETIVDANAADKLGQYVTRARRFRRAAWRARRTARYARERKVPVTWASACMQAPPSNSRATWRFREEPTEFGPAP